VLRIQVNGADREVTPGSTVAELVEGLALVAGRVAVERNGDVVPRRRWSEAVLAEGDRVEIVTFVGGG
jgi:sulfur carrier protein